MKENETLKDIVIGVYTHAIILARENKQTVGEKNDYYITLEQLEALLKRQFDI